MEDKMDSGAADRDTKEAEAFKMKHSSGDLHSRLKTRKLLGVGETDDGDVHRSKLSQILGHSEQLYIKLPRGLRIWQIFIALFFSTVAVWALASPRSLYTTFVEPSPGDSISLPIRLYGGAILSLSLMFWGAVHSPDRDTIRWSLLCTAIYFLVQLLVTGISLVQLGLLMHSGPRLLFHQALFASVSAYFYLHMDGKGNKIRKSNSSSNIASEAKAN